ncbi:hypothetical protein BS47DRAFT_1106378 [Hydnum rufescens UP504]|uniref:Uncharacterized protein n=1 Tax=Hydnum rufescens UP504 TaxID=1448309 RepID=A0A9P6DRD5_9AGAM|nr:hypothetical protein BS47DRAFT_1106378 [Hydnum rufescens UP504]
MNITHILGGSFLGNLLNALCLGVLTVQTSSYYRAFPNDRRPVKLVVAVLWTLEAFQLACGTQSLYWESSMVQINAVCASVTVQTFFAHRVYSLSANLYLGALVQVLVMVQFGFGAAYGIMLNTVNIKVIFKEYRWVAMSWMTTQAIADIVIATSLCLLLRHRRTGSQKCVY